MRVAWGVAAVMAAAIGGIGVAAAQDEDPIGRGDPAFAYSQQLLASKVVWSDDTLNTYLRNPFNMGTQINMIIHGIRDPQERADLIAFLRHEAK
jgi:cytochrome c